MVKNGQFVVWRLGREARCNLGSRYGKSVSSPYAIRAFSRGIYPGRFIANVPIAILIVSEAILYWDSLQTANTRLLRIPIGIGFAITAFWDFSYVIRV